MVVARGSYRGGGNRCSGHILAGVPLAEFVFKCTHLRRQHA